MLRGAAFDARLLQHESGRDRRAATSAIQRHSVHDLDGAGAENFASGRVVGRNKRSALRHSCRTSNHQAQVRADRWAYRGLRAPTALSSGAMRFAYCALRGLQFVNSFAVRKEMGNRESDPPGHETRAISIGIFIYLGDYGLDLEILLAL